MTSTIPILDETWVVSSRYERENPFLNLVDRYKSLLVDCFDFLSYISNVSPPKTSVCYLGESGVEYQLVFEKQQLHEELSRERYRLSQTRQELHESSRRRADDVGHVGARST